MQLLWNLIEVPLSSTVIKKDSAFFKILEVFYFPLNDFNKLFASFFQVVYSLLSEIVSLQALDF